MARNTSDLLADIRDNDDVDDDVRILLERLNGEVGALKRKTFALEERARDLEAENDQLREELAELREVVNPDPARTDYDSLSKDQKVYRVRRFLVEQAASSATGKSQLSYREVLTLFDGHPSAGHAYDLMDAAANLDGFAYGKNADGEKRVRVELDAVNDETLLHAANKATSDGGL